MHVCVLWSLTCVWSLKVLELRQELEARSLSSKGLKSQLIARLTKVLRMEQENKEKQKGSEEVAVAGIGI